MAKERRDTDEDSGNTSGEIDPGVLIDPFKILRESLLIAVPVVTPVVLKVR